MEQNSKEVRVRGNRDEIRERMTRSGCGESSQNPASCRGDWKFVFYSGGRENHWGF